jgi:hypothetical protein
MSSTGECIAEATRDEVAEAVAYLVGRCAHLARLAEVTRDPATLAGYFLAGYDDASPAVERLRALLAERSDSYN